MIPRMTLAALVSAWMKMDTSLFLTSETEYLLPRQPDTNVPLASCVNGSVQCHLHLHLHGCTQTREWIGDGYVRLAIILIVGMPRAAVASSRKYR